MRFATRGWLWLVSTDNCHQHDAPTAQRLLSPLMSPCDYFLQFQLSLKLYSPEALCWSIINLQTTEERHFITFLFILSPPEG